MENIKIDILPNLYLKEDGTFDKEKAFNICGKIAGVCYDKEGFNHLKDESLEKTNRRISMTLDNGHHSVYDHIFINFNIHNIPKILAMIINNEKQYTTSEKSARYTKIIRTDDSIITKEEEEIYNKWNSILVPIIKEKYGNVFNDSKINKLAQENARYFVTTFMPTEMIYTTSLRQINYIAAFMEKYIMEAHRNNSFEMMIANSMEDFINELIKLNIIDERLMKNEKNRKFSLFRDDIENIHGYFGDIYITSYYGTFAQLAQAQRHRTIDYSMNFKDDDKYFVPPIIKDNDSLVNEWLEDMNKVKNVFPQGKMVLIKESGTYEDFILKCKERLCSCAQLEINNQTKETLINYKNYLKAINSPLYEDIIKYDKGARCTFPDYKCNSDCGFKEGKVLKRKI